MRKIYSIIFGFNLIRFLIFFYFPLYFLSIGLNGLQIGLLMGLYTITGLIFSFHVGIKSDQIQQKTLLLWGLILFILFSIGLLITKNIVALLVLFFISGTSNIIIQRTSETIIMKGAKKQGKDMADFTIVRILPVVIGSILGAYIISLYSFNAVFVVSALLIIPILIVSLTLPSKETFNFPISDYLKDLKNKKVLAFSIIIFVFALHFGAEQTAYTPYLKEVLNLSIIESSYFISGIAIFLLVGAYFTGKALDKNYSKRKLLSYAMILSGLGGALFTFTNITFFAFMIRIFHDLGDGIFFVTMGAGILTLFDRKRVGGNSGFINVMIILGAFTGNILFGHIGFTYGYDIPHITSGVLSVLAGLLMIMFRK